MNACLGVATTCFLLAVQVSNQEQPRVLHFPADRSLGKIMICEPIPEVPVEGFHHWIRGEEWRYLGQARGDVSVPANRWIRLDVHRQESWHDLSPLLELRADDLYQFTVSGSQTGPKPGNACMRYVAHLTGLRVLGFGKTYITGAGMTCITDMKHLRRLTLPDRIDDAGLAHVGRLPALTGLYFGENRVTDAGLRHLARVETLEELALRGGRISDRGLAHLAKLPRLRYLLLEGRNFTDAGFLHLKNVSSLRTLHLGHLWQTTDVGLAYLAEMPQLQDLNFHWSEEITNRGVRHLSKLPYLRLLDVRHAKVDDKALAYLKDVKTLESLDLPAQGISDVGLAYLSELPGLRELNISRVHYVNPSRDKGYYTDKGVQMLAKCRLLERLIVGSIGMTDVSMKAIAQLPNLRDLTLFGCTAVTDQGLRQLASLKTLEMLTISDANTSISGLSCLNKLPNLRRLTVKDVRQDHTGLDLSGLKKLEKLTLGTRREDDPISDADVACLADLTQLRWFQTSRSTKTPRGLTNYGLAFLAGLTEMDRLTIGGPDLTDEGLAHLRWMKKLDMLNVFGGRFTDQGLKQLENLDALADLTLIGEHRFGPEDIRPLFETLPSLGRVRTGRQGAVRTILRENILRGSYRQQR